MSDTIKCSCSNCGAKYRLPAEAQGRTARCKRCGESFKIPRTQSLEDSVITWLTAPEEDEASETTPARPRVISMPTENHADSSEDPSHKTHSPIRLKPSAPKGESA